MNIRSLLLGSAALAGLTTGAYAADLGVMTSLDVCDSLGLSGLTISSDSNCLQITGGVSYQFRIGDYRSAANYDLLPANPFADADDGTNDFPVEGGKTGDSGEEYNTDWESKVDAWLQVVATQATDVGAAKVVIGLEQVQRYRTRDEGFTTTDSAQDPVDTRDGLDFYGQGINNDSTNGFELNEAYVAIGDSTVIMAGLRKSGKDGSVANIGDDTPYNYLGLFGSSITGSGVLFDDDFPLLGGASIQASTDLGNGVSASIGLENLDNVDGKAWDDPSFPFYDQSHYTGDGLMDPMLAGTLVGTIAYSGDGMSGHISGGALGVLDGDIDGWFAHLAGAATFDNFKLMAALGYADTSADGFFGEQTNLHAIVSGQATFDIFTLALSGEYLSADGPAATNEGDGFGIGGSIGAKVTDGVALNVGGRWFSFSPDAGSDADSWQAEAQIVASVTETITLTGAVGVYGGDVVEGSLAGLSGDDTAFYGSAKLAWAPGSGVSASVDALVTSEGAYRLGTDVKKTFQ
jgi:hypothetical protein